MSTKPTQFSTTAPKKQPIKDGEKKPFTQPIKKSPPKDKPSSQKFSSTTISIHKIRTQDLEGINNSEQLVNERIKILRKVMQSLASVEQVDESSVVHGQHMMVTFANREEAEKAFKVLKSKDALDNLQTQLSQTYHTLPKSVLPELLKYKYEWSDKPVTKKENKNAYVKKTDEKVVKKEVVPKKEKVDKVIKVEKPIEKVVEKVVEKKVKPVKKVDPVAEVPIKENGINGHSVVVHDAKSLRSEAEKARAQDELKYLGIQQSKVASEISAEKERCKSREEHIEKLTEDLERIEAEKQRIENQLKAESKWKQASVERILKLEEEMHHIEKEQAHTSSRLSGKVKH
jgi:hypothetical protein